MKPSDLSIGDWVQSVRTDGCFKVEEIMSVISPSRGKQILLKHEGSEIFLLSEVIPVRINGKILEKNGFAYSDLEPMFSHSYGGSETEPPKETIEIVHDLTNNEWTGEFFGPEGLAMQVRIRYVHELQRIMRCMGIDHDIVL